jgi:hypothetical protein
MVINGFHAELLGLVMCIHRKEDHWALSVYDRSSETTLYAAQTNNADRGRLLLPDFVQAELRHRCGEEFSLSDDDLIWTVLWRLLLLVVGDLISSPADGAGDQPSKVWAQRAAERTPVDRNVLARILRCSREISTLCSQACTTTFCEQEVI